MICRNILNAVGLGTKEPETDEEVVSNEATEVNKLEKPKQTYMIGEFPIPTNQPLDYDWATKNFPTSTQPNGMNK